MLPKHHNDNVVFSRINLYGPYYSTTIIFYMYLLLFMQYNCAINMLFNYVHSIQALE